MALHQQSSVRENLEDDVYASIDLSVCVPKYRFPGGEIDPRRAYSIVHDELMLDGNARQNLATFCQTWVEPAITHCGAHAPLPCPQAPAWQPPP